MHKFTQPPKHFFNHSILKTKYGDLNRKHPTHCLNELKKLFVCIYIKKKKGLKKEKLAKNTSIYQNLIIFIWAPVPFKKTENNLKSSSIFIFITMAHIA